MAADKPNSKWRNFIGWSLVGGAVGIGFAVAVSWLMQGAPPYALFKLPTDPKVVLVLLMTMSLNGLVSRNRRLDWPSFRNFLIWSAVACTVAVLAISGFRPLAKAGIFGAMGASRWAATAVGLTLMFFAVLLQLSLVAARRGWAVMDAEQVETLRERGRLTSLGGISMAAMGLMLVLLGLAGPGSVVTPAAALAGFVALLAVTTGLSFFVWRLMDELDRTLSYETGNMGFYLVLLLGGGWAAAAHLGFVAAAASLDWVTMLIVVTYAASLIAVGRRRLLTR